MTIGNAFKKFIAVRSVYCAEKTLIDYHGHLSLFFKYLEDKYGLPIDKIDFGTLPENDNIYSDYIVHLRKKKTVKNSSIRSYCRHAKAFLKFCYEEDICRDYIKKVKLPRDDSVLEMPLYADEVNKIDAVFDRFTVKGLRNYCIFHFMLGCGLRSQEVIGL